MFYTTFYTDVGFHVSQQYLFNFLKNYKKFFINGNYFTFQPTMLGLNFFYILPTLVIVILFQFSHPSEKEVVFTVTYPD